MCQKCQEKKLSQARAMLEKANDHNAALVAENQRLIDENQRLTGALFEAGEAIRAHRMEGIKARILNAAEALVEFVETAGIEEGNPDAFLPELEELEGAVDQLLDY